MLEEEACWAICVLKMRLCVASCLSLEASCLSCSSFYLLMVICWLTNCSVRFLRLGLDWLGLKTYCFMGNPCGFCGLAFGLNGGFICEDVFDHENSGWFLH